MSQQKDVAENGSAARPYIGGQAVIEGVMMRSPGSLSIVCRRRSGELVVRERPVPVASKGLRSLPFIRGVATVVESVKIGSQALRWSAELYEQDLAEEDKAEKSGGPTGTPRTPGITSAVAIGIAALCNLTGTEQPGDASLPGEPKKKGGLMSVLPIVFAIGLFVAAPHSSGSGSRSPRPGSRPSPVGRSS
jgi:hypothetical protein